MIKRSLLCLASVASVAFITGCEPDPLVANPSVSDVGVFEGCKVKYVDRGHRTRSFYIAWCGDTLTIKSEIQAGKVTLSQTTIQKQESIDDLKKRKDDLEAEMARLNKVSELMARLSPEDKALLGIQ